MMGSKAFESPLIGHARMRALYRALVEARGLGRGRAAGLAWPRGFEACLAGTAIDLKDGDLVSAGAGTWLIDHVRRVGARDVRRATRWPLGT